MRQVLGQMDRQTTWKEGSKESELIHSYIEICIIKYNTANEFSLPGRGGDRVSLVRKFSVGEGRASSGS